MAVQLGLALTFERATRTYVMSAGSVAWKLYSPEEHPNKIKDATTQPLQRPADFVENSALLDGDNKR